MRTAVRGRRLAQVMAPLACLLVLTAGCGSRLSEQQILAKNSLGQAGGSAGGAIGAGGAGVQASGQSGSVANGQPVGQAGSVGAVGGAGAGGGAVTGTGGGAAQSHTGVAGAAAASNQGKAPVTIGFIGALSGAAGVTVGPDRDGLVVWSKWVNDHGGINGHPVQVLVGDDGTNDAQGVAIAHDFVENKGAIALTWASNDITGLADYAKQKSVPIIGTVESQAVWTQNPMLFPMGAPGDAGGWATDRAMRTVGATKIAVFYCVEANTCQVTANTVQQHAAEEGVQVVYKAGVSITQPDFTAECLQARDSGAQGVVLFVDQSSVIRFMQSCLRQGYKPIPDGAANDAMAQMSEMDGLVSGGADFPWFLRSGAPGIDEYVQALQKYAPSMLTNGSSFQALGWTAGMIFEKAIENATQTTNPSQLTSADVLNGLWAMNGETIDGLLPGKLARTYHRNEPTPTVYCTLISRLEQGRWVALDGLNPQCK